MSKNDEIKKETHYKFGDTIIEDVVFTRRESFAVKWREFKHSLSLLKKSPLFFIGLFLILSLTLVALFASHLAPYTPDDVAHDNIKQTTYIKLPPMSFDNRTYLFWKTEAGSDSYLDFSAQFTDLQENSVIHSATIDYNNDGILDLVIGNDQGQLLAYKGSKKDIFILNWELDSVMTSAFPNLPSGVTEISPALGDLDNDTDMDLVIGTNTGKVYLSEFSGSSTSPVWSVFHPLTFTNGSDRVFPSVANPSLVNPNLIDLDRDFGGDGKGVDLILSSSDKKAYYFIQKDLSKDYFGTETQKWNTQFIQNTSYIFYPQPELIRNISTTEALDFTNFEGKGSMKLHFTRIGNDPRFDLIVSFESGEVYYFSLTGIYAKPDATHLKQTLFFITFKFPIFPDTQQLDFIMADFNQDSYQDLIIFSAEGVFFSYQYNIPDGRTHIFGTDPLGGDIYSKIIWALQLDLSLAVSIVFFSEVLGIIIGSIAGYYGGWVDNLIMRITDIFFAFPGLILAMAIAAALGKSMFNLGIAFIVVGWAGSSRLIRGQVMVEKNKLYVEAAKASGLGNLRIIFRHVLPNSIHPIIVSATLGLGGVILGFASLSFLGFGAGPGEAELGLMIAEGRFYFQTEPWIIFFPGIVIMAIVLGFNLLGDSLRDIMDPKLRR